MKDDQMDRILSQNEHQEILPSSGFVASVMDAIHAEAATPLPIAFPWKRAFPGLIAGVVSMGALFFLARSSAPLVIPPTLIPILQASGWALAATLTSLASLRLALHLSS